MVHEFDHQSCKNASLSRHRFLWWHRGRLHNVPDAWFLLQVQKTSQCGAEQHYTVLWPITKYSAKYCNVAVPEQWYRFVLLVESFRFRFLCIFVFWEIHLGICICFHFLLIVRTAQSSHHNGCCSCSLAACWCYHIKNVVFEIMKRS